MILYKTKNSVDKRPLQSQQAQPPHKAKQKESSQQLPIHENSMLPKLSMIEPLDLDDILIMPPVH